MFRVDELSPSSAYLECDGGPQTQVLCFFVIFVNYVLFAHVF
jgi:hypothetical protein